MKTNDPIWRCLLAASSLFLGACASDYKVSESQALQRANGESIHGVSDLDGDARTMSGRPSADLKGLQSFVGDR